MKKILLIVGIVIAVIVVGVPLVVSKVMLPEVRKEFAGDFPSGNLVAIKDYVDKNSEPWVQNQKMKYLGYDAPTEGDLQALKKSTDLTRHYPTTIKAVFDPGAISNSVDLLYYSDELADLGVNTFWVIGEYRMKNYHAYQFSPAFSQLGFPQLLSDADANKVLAWRILMAKKLGFATILIPDYPSVFNIGRQNYDLAKVEPELKRVALELAKIAQENGAEYFAPVNEYNHLMISNGYSIDEIATAERAFYKDLIPKIRQIYKGKIVIKNGAVNDWNNFPKESMVGADLFGVGNGFTGVRTKENMEPKVLAANTVSARDNVPWFETEFLVYRPIDQEHWLGYVESRAPMENVYKEGLDIFEKQAKGAVGFTFMGWTGVGKIRGTPAAGVMRDFFTRWQPAVKLTPNKEVVELAAKGMRSTSATSWLGNLPSYYLFAFKVLTGQIKPAERDPNMGEGGLPCKGKEECDAYCAKPEHQTECEKAMGGGSGGDQRGSGGPQDQSPQGPDTGSGRQGGPGGPGGLQQGGPGGCKSEAECQAFCSKPQNQTECRRYFGGAQEQR